MIVTSAEPVQPAGSCRPEPGSTGAGVAVLDADDFETSLPATVLDPADALSSADGLIDGPVDSAADADAASSDDGVEDDGVEDDAGLSPVIWISPQTTSTEHPNAAAMITDTHRVLRVFRPAIPPVCPRADRSRRNVQQMRRATGAAAGHRPADDIAEPGAR
ncbi:MAG: hypothetical protein ABJD68_09875 [Nakamurella sp.]